MVAVAVVGCDASLPYQPTFTEDVAPLFAARCQECHNADGIQPYVPLDYDSAKTYSEPILLEIANRAMPPWGADDSGICGTWQDARWLSDREIATLDDWLTGGLPQGPPDAVSAATPPPATPFRRDAVVDIGGVYQPGLGGGGYRCFVADPQLDRDRLLGAIRVTSDDPRGVAQVTLFALDSAAAEAQAAALDAAEGGLGYSCFGTTRTDDARLVASWSWPTPVLRMPDGTGVRLGAGRKLVVQIHYDITIPGPAFQSGTQVDLELDDGVTEARVMPISAAGPLAPGLATVSVDATLDVQEKLHVVAVAPRMHIRGRELDLLVERGAGARCIGSFPQWNFYQSQLFRAAAPAALSPGDRLHVYCAYGTEGRVDPVVFGDGIDDEECVAYLFVTD
jgi:hypothetical protein